MRLITPVGPATGSGQMWQRFPQNRSGSDPRYLAELEADLDRARRAATLKMTEYFRTTLINLFAEYPELDKISIEIAAGNGIPQVFIDGDLEAVEFEAIRKATTLAIGSAIQSQVVGDWTRMPGVTQDVQLASGSGECLGNNVDGYA